MNSTTHITKLNFPLLRAFLWIPRHWPYFSIRSNHVSSLMIDFSPISCPHRGQKWEKFLQSSVQKGTQQHSQPLKNQNIDIYVERTPPIVPRIIILTKPCLLLSWILKALQCVAICHWSYGFAANAEEYFPQSILFLSLNAMVGRKVEEFGLVWLKWLSSLFSGQMMVSLWYDDEMAMMMVMMKVLLQ